MAEQLKDYVLGPLVGFPFDSTLAVARMCFDGLFRDFPNVRFLVPHLGGAIPYLLPRLDQGYRDFPANRAKIDQPPSFYLKKLYFDTVSAGPSTVAFVRDLVGAERIAFGSDYPHLPGSMSGAVRPRELGFLKPRRRGCSRDRALDLNNLTLIPVSAPRWDRPGSPDAPGVAGDESYDADEDRDRGIGGRIGGLDAEEAPRRAG
jgi:hypothetical protein